MSELDVMSVKGSDARPAQIDYPKTAKLEDSVDSYENTENLPAEDFATRMKCANGFGFPTCQSRQFKTMGGQWIAYSNREESSLGVHESIGAGFRVFDGDGVSLHIGPQYHRSFGPDGLKPMHGFGFGFVISF